MLRRFLALLIFPATAAILVTGLGVWSRRAPVLRGGARYPVEVDAFVLLAPSVLLYLLTLPVIWRRIAHAPPRAVASFLSLAFALTLVGLVLLMGPLYSVLSAVHLTLADRALFWVFPFIPVLVAVAVSARAMRNHGGQSSRDCLHECRPSTSMPHRPHSLV